MPDQYAVVFSAAARRRMDKLPLSVATGLYERLTGPVASNPHRLGKELDPPYDGVWSTRRGEYRALYTINEEHRVITVVAVGHRRDAYRPR